MAAARGFLGFQLQKTTWWGTSNTLTMNSLFDYYDNNGATYRIITLYEKILKTNNGWPVATQNYITTEEVTSGDCGGKDEDKSVPITFAAGESVSPYLASNQQSSALFDNIHAAIMSNWLGLVITLNNLGFLSVFSKRFQCKWVKNTEKYVGKNAVFQLYLHSERTKTRLL